MPVHARLHSVAFRLVHKDRQVVGANRCAFPRDGNEKRIHPRTIRPGPVAAPAADGLLHEFIEWASGGGAGGSRPNRSNSRAAASVPVSPGLLHRRRCCPNSVTPPFIMPSIAVLLVPVFHATPAGRRIAPNRLRYQAASLRAVLWRKVDGRRLAGRLFAGVDIHAAPSPQQGRMNVTIPVGDTSDRSSFQARQAGVSAAHFTGAFGTTDDREAVVADRRWNY